MAPLADRYGVHPPSAPDTFPLYMCPLQRSKSCMACCFAATQGMSCRL